MAIKVWSLFEKLKLSELNNNFAELANRTVNGVSWGTNQNVSITTNPTQNLVSNTDLDTMTATGFYNAGAGNGIGNKPSRVDAFGLIVYKSAWGYVTQDLVEGNINPQKRWSRQRRGSSWSSWIEIYTTSLDGSETPTASNLGTITTHTAIRRGGVGRYNLRANSGTWLAGQGYELCVLSAPYRPTVIVWKEIILLRTTGGAVYGCSLLIAPSGAVTLYPRTAMTNLPIVIDETYTL